MDKAKRMRISQHMLQHIMKLMLALRIVRSPFLELTHRVNMFIARMQLFVNRKFYSVPTIIRISSPAYTFPASEYFYRLCHTVIRKKQTGAV